MAPDVLPLMMLEEELWEEEEEEWEEFEEEWEEEF